MRILFSSIGSHGHTYPLLPLAVAARDAGHDVRYATGPPFQRLLHDLGLQPLLSGMDMREAFGQLFAELGAAAPANRQEMSREQTLEFATRVFGDILPRRSAADLAPLIDEHRPDLVVYETADVGAGLAARRAGVPAACHGFGRVADGAYDVFGGGYVAAVASELGVDLPDGTRPGLGDPFIDICPPSIQGERFLAEVTRVPLRPVAFAEPGELPGWVREPGPPLVYLTMGTAFGDPSVLRRAITGLGRLDARVLVASGPTMDAAALGDLPGTVRVESWVAQADLLPLADLVVHHGGSGTTLGCLAAGVPQLFLPQGADQFFNADAVTAAGAGEQLLPDRLDEDAVADAAGRLLGSAEVGGAVDRFVAEIAALPAPAEVARDLDRLAA